MIAIENDSNGRVNLSTASALGADEDFANPERFIRKPKTKPKHSALILIFIVTVVIPTSYHLGPLRVSPYTIFLLLLFPVCLGAWVLGGVGKKTFADFIIVFFSIWSCLALIVNHPPAVFVESGGILIVQTMGAYFLGRYLIRDNISMRYLMNVAFWVILALLPFALIESFTTYPLYLNLVSFFGDAASDVYKPPRLGLDRAQVAFEHPILFGVFCASTFSWAACWFAPGASTLNRAFRSLIVFASSFLSLSTGALLSLVVQISLLVWGEITKSIKGQWKLFTGITVAAYLAVDLLSNRTPFHVFVSYATFNTHNSYNRILIWQYGSAEVWRHPFFGIGMQDWARPVWMSASMDNFWLVQAVRYGIPGFVFISLAFLLTLMRVGKATLHTDEDKSIRRGIMFSLIGTCIAICSVHLWNASYCWLLFVLGASSYLGNKRVIPDTEQSSPVDSNVNGPMERPKQFKAYQA